MTNTLLGILGGTFDPIHQGHLHIAAQLLEKLALPEIQFIPAAEPPHRTPPIASAEDRFMMVKLATQDKPAFSVNDLELKRAGPSRTVDTISALKITHPRKTLCCIIGADAFAHFETWHAPLTILKHCHLIVVNRPGIPVSNSLKAHHTTNPKALSWHTAGKILIQTIPPFPISATNIRKQIMENHLDRHVLPHAVADYIQAKGLYQHPP